MKIKVGDTVVIISGKDSGKKGEVLKVFPKSEKVVVKDVNIVTKHVKKTNERAGEKVQFEAPLHVSNVMFLGGESATRLGYSFDKKSGKKIRVEKKTGKEVKENFKKS